MNNRFARWIGTALAGAVWLAVYAVGGAAQAVAGVVS